MVDKIVYTYKFTHLPNIGVLKEDCCTWLVTVLDSFDPARGHRAFSYFSVIIKNWFIHKTKKHSFILRREVCCENLTNNLDWQTFSEPHKYQPTREEREFWQHLNEEIWQTWAKETMKPNERAVYEAVKYLFEKSEDIEIFNRKAIYLYLREITGLNTKQIVSNLNKFRRRYRVWRIRWANGDI
jgi:hypothetical protein